MRTVVATDGSCLRNPDGPGGWAWITNDGDYDSGGHPSTTNNIMELTAILQALRAFPAPAALHIQSDSKYSINCVTLWCIGWARNGWRKRKGEPIANLDLIRTIVNELDGRDVTFEWVRGHNGHHLNEAADDLANTAAMNNRNDTFQQLPSVKGISRTQARTVRCPECGTEPNQKCFRDDGTPRESNHLERVHFYLSAHPPVPSP